MKTFLCVALSVMFIASSALAQDSDDDYSEGSGDGLDTTGAVSFGFGLHSSANSLVDWDRDLTIDYWLDEAMAVGGSFALNNQSIAVGDFETTQTQIELDFMITYVLYAGKKTRLTVGGGLGLEYAMSDDGNDNTFEGSPFAVTIPAQLSLEHFFVDTISLGLNARFALYRIEVDDDGNDDTDDASRSWINVDTTSVGIELTWYTD